MHIKRIESQRNPVIRQALEVVVRRKRHRERAFLIEGPHLVEEAMGSSGTTLTRVFFTERFHKHHPSLWRRLAASGAELFQVSDVVMDKLAEAETPQGVAAIAGRGQISLEGLAFSAITVIADGIQDPGNLGTLIRTADAAGAGAVVLLGRTCDPYSPKALRASAGSVFHLPLLRADDAALLDVLERKRVALLVAIAHNGRSVFDADVSVPLAVAFGNETAGVRDAILSQAYLTVSVPMYGKAESLNVGAAASVVLYELKRKTTPRESA